MGHPSRDILQTERNMALKKGWEVKAGAGDLGVICIQVVIKAICRELLRGTCWAGRKPMAPTWALLRGRRKSRERHMQEVRERSSERERKKSTEQCPYSQGQRGNGWRPIKKAHRSWKSCKERLGNGMLPSFYKRHSEGSKGHLPFRELGNHWYKMSDLRETEFSALSFST